ncbi:hypothetical protein [Micromonospora sp. NPDC005161]
MRDDKLSRVARWSFVASGSPFAGNAAASLEKCCKCAPARGRFGPCGPGSSRAGHVAGPTLPWKKAEDGSWPEKTLSRKMSRAELDERSRRHSEEYGDQS